MENTTRLTWAIPVEAHILGASLEAYVESKASIRTFKLCAHYGKSSLAPVSTLPAELLDLVAGYIERSFFDERILEWEEGSHCVENFNDCEVCDSLETIDDKEPLEKHCDIVASQVQKVCNERSFDTALWRFNRFRGVSNKPPSFVDVEQNAKCSFRYSRENSASKSTSTSSAHGARATYETRIPILLVK